VAREKRRRQYGTGSIYQRASDGRWFGALEAGYTKSGTRHRPTVSAKTESEVKAKLKAKARALSRGDEGTSRVTVKAWAETWLDMTVRKVRPNTHTTDLAAVPWIIETIGHRRIDHLTPGDVRAVSTALREAGRSSSTQLRYHGVLIRMLKAAGAEGLPVPPLVLRIVGPKPAANDRQSMATVEALAVLKAAADLPHGSRWLCALLLGPRPAEALGLEWDAIYDGSLHISWQLQPLPYADKHDRSQGFRIPDGYEVRRLAGQMHLVRPKSGAGERVVPLLPVMADALEAWRALGPPSPHGLVWPALDGSPASEDDDREEWYGLQGAVNVGHPAGRYYYAHEARHTTATLLMEMKVPESVRIAIVGHSSVRSTKAYEHVTEAEMRRALEQVATRLQLG
jgi:integrase